MRRHFTSEPPAIAAAVRPSTSARRDRSRLIACCEPQAAYREDTPSLCPSDSVRACRLWRFSLCSSPSYACRLGSAAIERHDLVVAADRRTRIGALSGLALSVLSRRVVLLAVAVGIVAATMAIQVPWYYFGQSPVVGEHVDIRVLSSNLRKGRADASSFVALARSSADIITVSELTPEAAQRFSDAGIDAVFPYSLLFPASGAGGIGLWSRFPLTGLPPETSNATLVTAPVTGRRCSVRSGCRQRASSLRWYPRRANDSAIGEPVSPPPKWIWTTSPTSPGLRR